MMFNRSIYTWGTVINENKLPNCNLWFVGIMFPNTPLKLENRCYSSPTCYQDSEHEFQSMPWSTDHPTQWHYSKCHIWDIPTTKNHPMTKTTTQEAQQLRASYIKTSYKPANSLATQYEFTLREGRCSSSASVSPVFIMPSTAFPRTSDPLNESRFLSRCVYLHLFLFL